MDSSENNTTIEKLYTDSLNLGLISADKLRITSTISDKMTPEPARYIHFSFPNDRRVYHPQELGKYLITQSKSSSNNEEEYLINHFDELIALALDNKKLADFKKWYLLRINTTEQEEEIYQTDSIGVKILDKNGQLPKWAKSIFSKDK